MTAAPPEPVTRTCPRPVRRPVLRQNLADAVFAHWEVDPDATAAHLPPGVRPDTWEGRAYVGFVGVLMRAISPPHLPAPPYLGRFAQVNVRLYGVGPGGLRAVVFRSMESARLVPALVGRVAGLPYAWARVQAVRSGATLGYTVTRRGPRATQGSLVVHAGPPREPTAFEDFLTARWGLFTERGGRTWHLPLDHDPWPLHGADPVQVDPAPVRSAGLAVDGPPVSVLWSPGVTARFGGPWPLSSGARAGSRAP